MAEILIRGYKAKEQIEDLIEEARYGANNAMIGSGLEIVELPEHGELIDRDAFDADARKRYCSDCDNYNGTKCRACWVDDMLGDVAAFETVIPSNKEESNGMART